MPQSRGKYKSEIKSDGGKIMEGLLEHVQTWAFHLDEIGPRGLQCPPEEYYATTYSTGLNLLLFEEETSGVFGRNQ